MDNMAAGWDRPQEDEFALCNLGLPSPYLTIAFPNRPPQNQDYLDFAACRRGAWIAGSGFLWFLKWLTVRDAAADRLEVAAAHGPHRAPAGDVSQGPLLHIVRNPLVVFPSTINLWKRLYRNDGLQMPTYEGLDEHVFKTFTRMYEVFERDRGLIPAGQFCEVRYENLVAQPIQQMQRVYDELNLGGFEKSAADGGLLCKKADYKTNRYQLPPELAAEISRRWASFFQRYGYSTDG